MNLHRLALTGPTVDANHLIGLVWGLDVDLIVVPVSRLPADFFRLASGVAGEFLQKLVNHRLRLAVIGDLSALLEGSEALRDFVRESNRGSHAWFLADEAELERRLGGH